MLYPTLPSKAGEEELFNEEKAINQLLEMAEIDSKKTSKCIRAGLARGHFGFKFDGSQLDQVVLEASCDEAANREPTDDSCNGNVRAIVRELLFQSDEPDFPFSKIK